MEKNMARHGLSCSLQRVWRDTIRADKNELVDTTICSPPSFPRGMTNSAGEPSPVPTAKQQSTREKKVGAELTRRKLH